MRTKHLALGLLVAVPMMVVGQVADAKVKDQSRNTSEVNVVEAWFDFEGDGFQVNGQLGAYETAHGPVIGWLNMYRHWDCGADDFFQSFEEPGVAVIEIARRNESATVTGEIFGWWDGTNCGGEIGGQEVWVHVDLALSSNGVRVRSTETNSEAGPDFSSTSRYTFSGMGANGTMAWWFTPPPGEEPDAETYNVEGRIGTAKSSDSNRSG